MQHSIVLIVVVCYGVITQTPLRIAVVRSINFVQLILAHRAIVFVLNYPQIDQLWIIDMKNQRFVSISHKVAFDLGLKHFVWLSVSIFERKLRTVVLYNNCHSYADRWSSVFFCDYSSRWVTAARRMHRIPWPPNDDEDAVAGMWQDCWCCLLLQQLAKLTVSQLYWPCSS